MPDYTNELRSVALTSCKGWTSLIFKYYGENFPGKLTFTSCCNLCNMCPLYCEKGFIQGVLKQAKKISVL